MLCPTPSFPTSSAGFAPATSKPPKSCRVADLRGQGYEWAEIAAQLGGTAEARRKQLARALDRIELALEESVASITPLPLSESGAAGGRLAKLRISALDSPGADGLGMGDPGQTRFGIRDPARWGQKAAGPGIGSEGHPPDRAAELAPDRATGRRHCLDRERRLSWSRSSRPRGWTG